MDRNTVHLKDLDVADRDTEKLGFGEEFSVLLGPGPNLG